MSALSDYFLPKNKGDSCPENPQSSVNASASASASDSPNQQRPAIQGLRKCFVFCFNLALSDRNMQLKFSLKRVLEYVNVAGRDLSFWM